MTVDANRPLGPEDPTHVTLLARLQGTHDPEAWLQFCHRYGQLIRAYAQRHGLRQYDSDEVMQMVHESLLKRLPHFVYRGDLSFRHYLSKVVRNTVAQVWSKRNDRGRLISWEQAPQVAEQLLASNEAELVWEDEWQQYHLRLGLRRLEANLNHLHWQAFQRFVMEKIPAEEVAVELDLSVDSIYQIKRRGMVRLREIIASQVRDEG
jgi:RNA polymerase sigma factor (sigma-70 family)